ncbi:MAG TPA: sulfite exporter TauE/SafE family protein [Casimicrobiaceae bacterium]|jgi:uncharacterized membrane protein YfcA
MDWTFVPAYVALGAGIGFLAGLLGIGGGFTIVPVLTLLFTYQAFPAAHVVHMAVATSTGSVLFTAMASTRAHHRHGAVLWKVVAALAPGLVIGSLVAPQLAARISGTALASLFCAVTAIAAFQIGRGTRPKASRDLPGRGPLALLGLVVGLLASFVGTGGAFIVVPFMTWCNVRLQNAIATSAALGVPVALCGATSFIVAGWHQPDLPPLSLGYIYVPALAGIVVASVLTAPIGARVAHRLPIRRLRISFATMLLVLSSYMFYRIVSA